MAGRLCASTTAIATIRNQPAPCHGHEMPRCRESWYVFRNARNPPANKISGATEGKKCELWCATGDRVVGRPFAGAYPHRVDRKEHHGGHRNTDAEADGLEHALPGAGVAVAQIFSGAVHS